MPKQTRAGYRLIFNTCPNLKVARSIATLLVRERLAACANVMPMAQSIYRWQGKVESAREVLLLIKVRAADYKRVERRIKALHPYELPEIISVGIADGYARYLAWLGNPDKI